MSGAGEGGGKRKKREGSKEREKRENVVAVWVGLYASVWHRYIILEF